MSRDDVTAGERGVASWGHRAASFWLNMLFGAVRRAPRLVRALAPVCAAGVWALSPGTRRNLLANARRLLDEQATPADHRRLAIGVIRSFYVVVCDIALGRNMTLDELFDRVDVAEGKEHYHAARALGRGAVIVTAHLGSFEVGVAALRQREPRVHIVFHTDPFGRFDRIRSELHARLGVIEARVDRGWGVWADLRDALARDEVVVVQGDRVMPGQKGVAAPLARGHVVLPVGPFKLAQLAGAPILPVFSVRLPCGKVRMIVEPAIQPRAGHGWSADEPLSPLLRFASVLNKHIVAHPEQWLVMHRAFVEDQPANSGEKPCAPQTSGS